MSSHDFRHPNFNLLTDANLFRYIASVRDGVLIGTRPSINLAVAHLTAPSVVRIGQDHMNLATYRDGLRAQLKAVYPRLDLVSTLTEGDAEDYRRLLRGKTRVECMPNGVADTAGLRAPLDNKVVIAAGPGHAAEGVRPAAAGMGEGGPGPPGLGAADLRRGQCRRRSCASRSRSWGSATARA